MSSVNEVTICSNALGRLGVKPITALLDDTERARLCNRNYSVQRDAVLQAHPWNWATAIVALVQLADAPAAGFSRRFQLPTDHLKVHRVFPEKAGYKIIGDTLHTNETSISIEYIQRITDTTMFSPLFVDALEAKLASVMAIPLKSNENITRLMFAQYQDALSRAQSRDSQEGSTEAIISDDFIVERLRGGAGTTDSTCW